MPISINSVYLSMFLRAEKGSWRAPRCPTFDSLQNYSTFYWRSRHLSLSNSSFISWQSVWALRSSAKKHFWLTKNTFFTIAAAVFVPFRFTSTARLLSSLQNGCIYVRIITTFDNNFRTVRIPLESQHAVSRVLLQQIYTRTRVF